MFPIFTQQSISAFFFLKNVEMLKIFHSV